MSGHAIYSPSGAKKWLTCAGSIAMEHGIPNIGNEYTDEGTAAHALAEMSLSENKHPVAFIGRVLHVVDGVYRASLTDGEVVRSFTVDAEMAGHVNQYVQSIRQYAEGNDAFYEEALPIGHITGEEGATGTGDAVIIADGGDEIQVHDLKFGRGIEVSAERNPQMMLYALGAVEKFSAIYGTPKRIRLVIHQPRISGAPDEWDCSYEELVAFGAHASERAKASQTAFEFRENWLGTDNPYLTPGDHCKNAFCRARATCPALAKFVAGTIGADFEVLSSGDKPVQELVAEQTAGGHDLKRLGQLNSCVDLIQDWCKQIRAKVEAALFEHNNGAEAQAALGFKLVQGKKGNRQWANESEVETLLKKMRLKTEEIYDFSVKSPTKILEALKDQPKRVAKLTPLVTQKEGQASVAPLSDKRAPLVIKPPADDFEAVDGSDLV